MLLFYRSACVLVRKGHLLTDFRFIRRSSAPFLLLVLVPFVVEYPWRSRGWRGIDFAAIAVVSACLRVSGRL